MHSLLVLLHLLSCWCTWLRTHRNISPLYRGSKVKYTTAWWWAPWRRWQQVSINDYCAQTKALPPHKHIPTPALLCTGLGKTVFPNLETLVKVASLTYFNLFKSQTVDYFTRSIDVFWNTPVTAPVLLFYCENDLMSNAQITEELIDYWRKRGMHVTAKKWEDSIHAGHLKKHPHEYVSHVDRFLCSLQLTPLKARL